MAFGFSAGDVVWLIKWADHVFEKIQDAPQEYAVLFGTFHYSRLAFKKLPQKIMVVKEHLEVDADDKAMFDQLVKNCKVPLRRIRRLVHDFKRLGNGTATAWERATFPRQQFHELTANLGFRYHELSSLLHDLMFKLVNNLQQTIPQIREILEIVRQMGAETRSGERAHSVLSTQAQQSEEIWSEVRTRLKQVKLDKSHKAQIVEYILGLFERGEFDEKVLDEDDLGDGDVWMAISQDKTMPEKPISPDEVNQIKAAEGLIVQSSARIADVCVQTDEVLDCTGCGRNALTSHYVSVELSCISAKLTEVEKERKALRDRSKLLFKANQKLILQTKRLRTRLRNTIIIKRSDQRQPMPADVASRREFVSAGTQTAKGDVYLDFTDGRVSSPLVSAPTQTLPARPQSQEYSTSRSVIGFEKTKFTLLNGWDSHSRGCNSCMKFYEIKSNIGSGQLDGSTLCDKGCQYAHQLDSMLQYKNNKVWKRGGNGDDLTSTFIPENWSRLKAFLAAIDQTKLLQFVQTDENLQRREFASMTCNECHKWCSIGEARFVGLATQMHCIRCFRREVS